MGKQCLNQSSTHSSSIIRTLAAWHETFNAKLDQIRPLGFDEPFIRIWNYYLKYCEAGFATRNISVVQAIFTRRNNVKF